MQNERIRRRSYHKIPPRMEYSLSEKGRSVMPILQNICRWTGAYHRKDPSETRIRCKTCEDIHPRQDGCGHKASPFKQGFTACTVCVRGGMAGVLDRSCTA